MLSPRIGREGVLSVWPSCPRVPSSYLLSFPLEGHRAWYVWPDGIFPLYFPPRSCARYQIPLAPPLLRRRRSFRLAVSRAVFHTDVRPWSSLPLYSSLRLGLSRVHARQKQGYSVVGCSLLQDRTEDKTNTENEQPAEAHDDAASGITRLYRGRGTSRATPEIDTYRREKYEVRLNLSEVISRDRDIYIYPLRICAASLRGTFNWMPRRLSPTLHI